MVVSQSIIKSSLKDGVTGIIRCRNHAAFLNLGIESCIEALDEIIAIYHDSTDETEDILLRYKELYPEKFSVIKYNHYVFPLDLLFSGYTNYALKHASYKWTFRIDADQIYFSEKLKVICDSFRRGYGELKQFYSGINLIEKKGKWFVCIGKPNGFYPLFNGYGDHFFHPNIENKKYIKYSRLKKDRKQRLSEVFPIETNLDPGGFLWFHIKNLLLENLPETKEKIIKHQDSFIELSELITNDFKSFSNKYNPCIPFKFAYNLYNVLWDRQNMEIPWSMLDRIMVQHKNNLAKATKFHSNNEYEWEFYNDLNARLDTFIDEFGSQMSFGDIDLSSVVRLILYTHLKDESEHYITCRKNGKSNEMSFSRVDRLLDLLRIKDASSTNAISNSHPQWEKLLEHLKGCVLVYSDQSVTLLSKLAKLSYIKEPVLLVTLDDFPETDIEIPDNFSALQLQFTGIMFHDNVFLRKCFPFIIKYANSFSWLLSLTVPKQIIICPSDSIETQILHVIATECNIYTKTLVS